MKRGSRMPDRPTKMKKAASPNRSPVGEYIHALKTAPGFASQVVFHRVLAPRAAAFSEPNRPWPEPLRHVLELSGITSLFSHQTRAIDRVGSGRHTVVATPTASGKTLVYNLSVVANFFQDEAARALYIFPLKALAQDQKKTFEKLVALCPPPVPTVAIYDGDTTAWHRKKIRRTPPTVLISNPEMIHLSLLPYHHQWADFYVGLKMVVVDEVHTYRGIMGSHMAQVFRRLIRICAHYGAQPTFVFSSATVGNPGALAEQLTGLAVSAVEDSGAPRGKRHLVFMDPADGPARAAIHLLKAALHRGLRTIVYTQSRKMTELIALWASNQAGQFADRISAYRAGFLPEERREIEARLASGELLAVISTSALELGIDIGDLDLCLLVGYPGTVVSTWQRGGRVGRGGQDSALVLIAGDDALDQYFLRHPEQLISQAPESAVVNPENTDILTRHLPCAAAELPLKAAEAYVNSDTARQVVRTLVKTGDLLRSADGSELYSRRKAPHRNVNLRGSGNRFQIISETSGENTGEIDEFRAYRETHPGAVYLHKGETYVVNGLDPNTATVRVTPRRVDYYTRVMGNKQTEILDIHEQRDVWGTRGYAGRLKVTDQVTGYETWRLRGNKRLNRFPLDLPPQIFETQGLWFDIPSAAQQAAERQFYHFMGGIHAIEHAAIGIFPLLVMTDRNDLGGISTPYHPQTGGAAVFIYDAVPGGAGLCREAFAGAEKLLVYTRNAIESCACETGCPACVHSPKCGSGNRPIDKAAAIFLLRRIERTPPVLPSPRPRNTVSDIVEKTAPTPQKQKATPTGSHPVRFVSRVRHRGQQRHRNHTPSPETPVRHRREKLRFGVFDLETQRSAEEVGGWHRADLMRVSCGVVYDTLTNAYHEYRDGQVDALIAHLQKLDRVVGFNIVRFDYRVLSGYSSFDFKRLNTLDILQVVHGHLGYRLSLDHLATVNLGSKKTADGLQALKWWKEGRIDDIVAYCKKDVEITKNLYGLGRDNGFLLFDNKAGQRVRIPVNW